LEPALLASLLLLNFSKEERKRRSLWSKKAMPSNAGIVLKTRSAIALNAIHAPSQPVSAVLEPSQMANFH